MARELNEQEKEARGATFNKFADDKRGRVTIQETNAFNAGFAAGLDYRQAENERLRAALVAMVYEFENHSYCPNPGALHKARAALAGRVDSPTG